MERDDGYGSDVLDALRQFLAADREFGAVREIRRQPSAYRSSFALEEIAFLLADGRSLQVMFKDLGWHSLTPAGQQAKPALLYDPAREIEVYGRVLPVGLLGTPRPYGAVADPARALLALHGEGAGRRTISIWRLGCLAPCGTLAGGDA